ncbi:UNVERIFIED_CONTAM: hypothetical protein HDU68_012869 [Siphonaria sp. JEL0065]|nr:hypothetical protein HDU68_012869 [Siphonaria sp. JEL0065]
MNTTFYSNIPRLLSYDTGRFQMIPKEHFGLDQQAPTAVFNTSFNLKNAMEYARHDYKYFKECYADSKRDARYGPADICDATQQTQWPPPEVPHNLTLVHESLAGILKAWSEFSEQQELTWWIQHGALLGWFWNSKLLPWDLDLDIGVPTRDLLQLLEFNNTLLEGRFLIDISPNVVIRSHQDENSIDGRVVDIDTGFFMDIAGISHISDNIPRFLCKNLHEYSHEDLVPLHETILEGIRVWRPKAAVRFLVEEYSEYSVIRDDFRLTATEVYKFNHDSREWKHTLFDNRGHPIKQ